MKALNGMILQSFYCIFILDGNCSAVGCWDLAVLLQVLAILVQDPGLLQNIFKVGVDFGSGPCAVFRLKKHN